MRIPNRGIGVKQSRFGRREFLYAGSMVLAAGVLASCTDKETPVERKFKSVDLTGADYAKDFALTYHHGQARTLKDFRGKIVVVFFGFTQCPDVCPTTMAELSEVKRLLGPDAGKLQAIFISVDPERDTPLLLEAYMRNFDPTFLAMRPSPEELAAVASHFKIYYKKVDGSKPGLYSMDHTAGTFVFDPQGRIRLYGRYGSGAQPLAQDIQLLLKGA